MQIFDCEQGTSEWFAVRLGVPTASNFSKVMAKGSGATRKAYMLQLAAEIITGEKAESFSNAAMEWGIAHEEQARSAYEFAKDVQCSLIGFCKLEVNAGCSPDALVGDDGLLEIKCPSTATHIETVISGKMPTKHKPQVQGQLWVTGRDWCEFVSFDPRVKTKRDFFCVRVQRDQDYIDNLALEINRFNDDLNNILQQLDYRRAA